MCHDGRYYSPSSPDLPRHGPNAGDVDPSVHGARQGPHEQSCGAEGLGSGRGARPVCLLQKGWRRSMQCFKNKKLKKTKSFGSGVQSGATDLGPFLAGPGERQETLQEGPGFWF